MSTVAEFARTIHEQGRERSARGMEPLAYPSQVERLYDIKAVIFDVYGTLIDYWRPGFESEQRKLHLLEEAFAKTAQYFEMVPVLERMNPDMPAAHTLRDFYHGLIAMEHQKAREKGTDFPEVRIEKIWQVIIMLLSRNGYDPQQMDLGDMESLSRCMAWFYNYHALGRGFYPGVVETLQRLRDQNIRLGILSNAQFYTPIDLTLFLRDEAGDRYDDYLELFDIDLVYYSYEHGAAKPSHALYRRLFDGLYELHILPMDTVLVGNDLAADIAPAAEAGLKTAFFAGDNTSALTHDLGGSVVPDITFLSWYELSERISFYEEKKAQ